MDDLSTFFLNGKYTDCLEKIEYLKTYSNSNSEHHILENNSFICKASIFLAEKDETKCEGLLEEMFFWLKNLSRTPQNPKFKTLSVQFNIITTAQCLSLTASLNDTEFLFKCLKSVDDCTTRVLGVTATLDPMDDENACLECLKKLPKCLKHLSSIKSPLLPAFTKLVAMTILHVLCSSPLSSLHFKVLPIIEDVLSHHSEITSLAPFLQQNKNTPIYALGWHLEPSLLDNSDINTSIGFIAILGSVLQVNGSHFKTLPYLEKGKSQWLELTSYIQALQNFKLGDFNSVLGLLLNTTSPSSSTTMQCRERCLLGRIYSAMGEREKAVDNFTNALKLDKLMAEAHYYKGLEFGRMGLPDLMLKSYQNLTMITKKRAKKVKSPESAVLEILHRTEGVTRVCSIYLLAVAYGLNDMVNESAMAFQKLLSIPNICNMIDSQSEESIVSLPPMSTILHEAGATFLLNGDLQSAEDMINRAMLMYPQRTTSNQQCKYDTTHPIKDFRWLQNVLSNKIDVTPDPLHEQPVCNETYLSLFDEDVIGLLLLADLQRIQGSTEARLTINHALLLLSKYLAKSNEQSPENLTTNTLVKALAAKTCVHIANMQASVRPFPEVDKMFRRALSSNKGDKDILYQYATFLVSQNKMGDAQKLWNTFFRQESIVHVDFTQSLALRYLLRIQVSCRQLATLSNKLHVNT